MKHMIFHVPFYVDPHHKSGSHIRPRKMLEAFRAEGYTVDVVMGYAKDRARAIQEIKKKVRAGVPYEFCYSESSTMPTLLTEKHHLPTHPFLDFSFFRFLKEYDIPIGLFYRDCHWLFPQYQNQVSPWKAHIAKKNYLYDLKQYNKWLTVLYMPSVRMQNSLPVHIQIPVKALPPGADDLPSPPKNNEREKNQPLRLFYVGGIIGIYEFSSLLAAVQQTSGVELCLCCRESEWEQAKTYYSPYLCDRIQVIHKSGPAFAPDIQKADVALIYNPTSDYRNFAMPVKLFEYLGYGKPILATAATAAGDFIEKNQIGWTIPYSTEAAKSWMQELLRDPTQIEKKRSAIHEVLENNTWQQRARQVAHDLT